MDFGGLLQQELQFWGTWDAAHARLAVATEEILMLEVYDVAILPLGLQFLLVTHGTRVQH